MLCLSSETNLEFFLRRHTFWLIFGVGVQNRIPITIMFIYIPFKWGLCIKIRITLLKYCRPLNFHNLFFYKSTKQRADREQLS